MPLDTRRGFSARNWRARRSDTQVDWEGGFTLIELIIVVAVLPLVVGAVAVALLSVFSQQTTVSNTLTASGDAQVVSARYVSDIQSAAWITTQTAGAHTMCGYSSGSQVVTTSADLLQPFTSSNPNPTLVSYVNVPVAGSSPTQYQLQRERCTNGNTSAPVGSTAVSRGLTNLQNALIQPSAEQAAAQSGWIQASLVSGLQLTVTRTSANDTYSLTAVPRVWNPANNGNPPFIPIVPLTLLNSSCNPAPLTLSGNSTVATVDGGSGLLGFSSTCSPQTSINGGATLSAAPPPYATGVPDPFSTLNPPPTHPATNGAGSCTSTGKKSETCSTGSYATGPSLSKTTTFDPNTGPNPLSSPPAVFVFSNTVDISGQSTVSFNGGSDVTKVIYWFQQGLTIEGGSSVTFGPGTYIFGDDQVVPSGNCCLSIAGGATILGPVQTQGLLFYVEAGPATYNGGTNTPIAGSSTYEGIAIWDAVSCAPPSVSGCALTLSGGSTLTTPLGGVYDPNGVVQFTGGSPMNTSFIVTKYANLSGGTQVTIQGSP